MQDFSSPDKLLNILFQLEVATAIYESDDIIIRFANHAMLKFWGKDETVIGKPLEEAVPELRGQPFKLMLQDVLRTGVIKKGVIPATTRINGKLQTAYYEYCYTPVLNEHGTPYCIINTAKDVTELQLAEQEKQRLSSNLSSVNEELATVNIELRSANKDLERSQKELKTTFLQLEESEFALRLAIEAANFGTWHIHSETRQLITSARLRELFGYTSEEQITIEDALAQITVEYRDYVSKALENAIYFGGHYDVTYPVIGFHNQKQRWLRAIGKLKAHFSGDFSAFTGVVMDVTELKENEARKDDFISMASHELKTPVTSLSAYLQILHKKAIQLDDSFNADGLSKAMKQVRRITTLINSFLNVSRLESGKIYIDKKQFDMTDLIEDLHLDAIELYASHQIIFYPVPTMIINADYDKIGQVITNFVSNAVKYSPFRSKIEIRCQKVADTVQVSVSDRGVGISENEIPRLFERYYRIESTDLIAGFGLGLYLCSEIISRHNGKIWVESELKNGSVFNFSIPLN